MEISADDFGELWGRDVQAGPPLGLPQTGYSFLLQQKVTVRTSSWKGLELYSTDDDQEDTDTAKQTHRQAEDKVAARKKPTIPKAKPKVKAKAPAAKHRPNRGRSHNKFSRSGSGTGAWRDGVRGGGWGDLGSLIFSLAIGFAVAGILACFMSVVFGVASIRYKADYVLVA
ncbi:hypothetical protein F4553_001986 [Allocatelliglobosispora scoriae]|uniref:Uncharacterized protein n=1 Tax=Allocatelliglobosispora scoriae TaxID=643052 RepID=A0A841BHN0_9ACTN|nr:hypothetical protein [Allocatelliglobosispora scoriae]MBB5868607.1 hypothetical protein [Allocatelliglobosispora scoriae]